MSADETATPRRDLIAEVLGYVSRGRGYIGVTPYPDATARRALAMWQERTATTEVCGCGCPMIVCPWCWDARCGHCDPICESESHDCGPDCGDTA